MADNKIIYADKLRQVIVEDKQIRGPAFAAVMRHLSAAPAVEARPVVYGRWIHCNGKSNLWYCSECGEKISYNPTRRTYNIEKRPVYEVNKHCRNCGAKMDGGNEDV